MTGNIRQALGLLAIAAAFLLAGIGMDPTPGDVIVGIGTLLGVGALAWLGIELLKSSRDRQPSRQD